MKNEKRNYLHELRKKKGLTLKSMAKLAEINSYSTYACYETGDREPDLETMVRIAKVLGEKDLIKLFRKGGVVISDNSNTKNK